MLAKPQLRSDGSNWLLTTPPRNLKDRRWHFSEFSHSRPVLLTSLQSEFHWCWHNHLSLFPFTSPQPVGRWSNSSAYLTFETSNFFPNRNSIILFLSFILLFLSITSVNSRWSFCLSSNSITNLPQLHPYPPFLLDPGTAPLSPASFLKTTSFISLTGTPILL
jgi:hypothetical protein